MQYLIRAYDGENVLPRRMEVRGEHLENITKVDGRVLCAGGLLDEEGRMKGSALIMEFESDEKLEQYLKTEPYIVAKVWERVEIEPMNVVIFDDEKVGK